jgi:SAM-dependent methyltransferase
MINKTFLGNKKMVNILDIGCSKGTFYQFWRSNFQPMKKPSISYLGLDIRDKVINYCKEKLENVEKRVQFLKLDIMNDEIPEGPKYDVVLFMEIVEHVPVADGRRMMQKIYDDLLADDGIMFISSPSPKKHLGQMLTNPGDHIFEYSAEEMEAMIKEFGYEIVDMSGWFCRGRFMRAGLNEAELELYNKLGRLGSGLRAGIFSFLRPDRAECYTFCVKKSSNQQQIDEKTEVIEEKKVKSIIDF